jgi:hypothetical protein
MNRDFAEMLSALFAAGVEFIIVGAHALAVHGYPRATGDLDIWVRPEADNADRVLNALREFGAPLLDLSKQDLMRDDTVFQFGVPPNRIDLLTGISGVNFEAAWQRRVFTEMDGMKLPVLSREDLILNKRTVGRPKDRLDVEWLEQEPDTR